MSAPRITVLIDTYNYGAFIEQAVESALPHHLAPDLVEVLVVDDGSTDDTAARLARFGSSIRYLHKPNGGQGSAFNLGVKEARGEIVALLDADDYFLPGKLSRLLCEFDRHPEAGLVYHGLQQLNSQTGSQTGTQTGTQTGSFAAIQLPLVSGSILDDTAMLFSYAPCPTSCLAFRRSLLLEILPMPERIRIQADTYLGLLAPLLAPVQAIPEALAVYRAHGENLFYDENGPVSPERRARQFEMFMAVLADVKAWVRSHRDRVDLSRAMLFLNRCPTVWRREYFKSFPPSRWQFFSFLLEQNFRYQRQQTLPFTVFNYLTALAALCYPRGQMDRFYDWQSRAIRALRVLSPRM
jgi:glycosyltransferase involved in cell wall biosynthesis